MPQNFSGQNLRGRNFKDRKDLVRADFSNADIRGANFTNANLTGARFIGAKAGLLISHKIGLALISTILIFLSGYAIALAAYGAIPAVGLYGQSGQEEWRTNYLLGLFNVLILLIFTVTTIWQNLATSLRYVASAIFLTVAIFLALNILRVGPLYIAGNFFTIEWTAAAAISTPLNCLTLPILMLVNKISLTNVPEINTREDDDDKVGIFLRSVIAILGSFFSFYPVINTGRIDFFSITYVGFFCIVTIFLSSYLSRNALFYLEINKYKSLKDIATALASIGGTNWNRANLTDANFTNAILQGTNLINAKLIRTCFAEAKGLDLARVGDSLLSEYKVRKLLIGKDGYRKSYVGANLRGADLRGCDLRYANLKQADISEANLENADLRNANLTEIQAIATNFTRAYLTGACLQAWNIDSTTKLEQVDCRFIDLLEYPKPGTDDRERRPSSGEFAPGEFTKLFQEVLTTVDLIFRNGVDWKAFTAAFQKVQVENEDTELTIQSIENKGDGVVVVRVSVPPDTNKAKIHSEFTQNYDLALKAIEEKYQSKIESKDEQITIYRQQLEDSRQREIRQNSNMEKIIDILANTAANVPVNESEVKAIAERQTAVNLVILTLGTGDFNKGFPSVTAQIWTEGDRLPIQPNPGELPPAPEIAEVYHNWQSQYNGFIEEKNKISRMERKQGNVTSFSQVDIEKLAEELEEKLNKWLNAEQFLSIDRILRERFNRSDEIQVIIQSENIHVRRLPWHLWDFLKPYRKAEIALSSPFYDRTLKTAVTRNRIRILSILGDDKGIDINKDRQLLDKFDAEKAFIVKPNSQELKAQLWSEKGWDILCFSGHSSSEMDGSNGYIYINDTEKITIPELKNALTTAIERGLQIAIFNSCDGLGLANQLASLHIPQIIVMREPVPDKVAQEFLKNFLTAFASGKSFYLAVREAREKLQSLEEYFPCASWLPVICQNPAEIPPTWESLR